MNPNDPAQGGQTPPVQDPVQGGTTPPPAPTEPTPPAGGPTDPGAPAPMPEPQPGTSTEDPNAGTNQGGAPTA